MKKDRWSIIYEDDSVIVINKPPNWSSIPDRFDESKQNIYASISSYRDQIYMVHRLDRDTSGVMVLAKTKSAHKHLSEQFEQREIEKVYHAFVEATPRENQFEVDAPIVYSHSSKSQVYIGKTGKESFTSFKLLEQWKDFSLLECRPKTGRMHQIRIHLQHAGHPLIIDPSYGTRSEFKISEIKSRKKYHLKKYTEERPLLKRHTLHAYSLSFVNPENNKKESYTVEYPKDLRALKNQLGKWNAI